MDFDNFPLGMFEVDCDGSACGSHPGYRYVHPCQTGDEPICRVRIENGRRVEYIPLVEEG
jgi:hypothetical protein